MAKEYQIRIEGHLGSQWAEWFDGLSITLEADGKTLLSGPVPDQPALYGLLRKVRDLGMPLVSVNQVYSIKGENSMDTKVNTYRTTAKVVGALYIMGFVVGIAGSVLSTRVLYPNSAHRSPVAAATEVLPTPPLPVIIIKRIDCLARLNVVHLYIVTLCNGD